MLETKRFYSKNEVKSTHEFEVPLPPSQIFLMKTKVRGRGPSSNRAVRFVSKSVVFEAKRASVCRDLFAASKVVIGTLISTRLTSYTESLTDCRCVIEIDIDEVSKIFFKPN